ncbi:MAG: hypothetical protein ACRECD_03545 [Burkholderiaceae bacterium]
MSKRFLKLLALTCVTASTLSWSATPDEHASHHRAAAPAKPAAKTASKAASVPRAASAHMTAMEPQMETMREMHEKMMNATTPEERSALMADHMKACALWATCPRWNFHLPELSFTYAPPAPRPHDRLAAPARLGG